MTSSTMLAALAVLRGAPPAVALASGTFSDGQAASGASILDPSFSRSLPALAMQIPPSQTGQPAAAPRILPLEAQPARVVEAVVLGNTLLTSGGATPTPTRPVLQIPPELQGRMPPPVLKSGPAPTSTSAGLAGQLPTLGGGSLPTPPAGTLPALYRVEVETGGRRLDLLSTLPLPIRGKAQIAVTGETLRLLAFAPTRGMGAPAASAAGGPAPSSLQALLTTVIQSALRQTLPQQQPLHLPLARLQQLAAQGSLPLPLREPLQTLLKTLPSPAELSQPASLRQALDRSGAVTEARLAKALAESPSTAPGTRIAAPSARAEAVAAVLGDDRRAQLGAVIAQLRPLLASVPPSARPAFGPEPQASNIDPSLLKEAILANTALPQQGIGGDPAADESELADLAGLQRLLQTAVARLQHQQLETVASRQPGPDGAPQLPTWLFELPIQTPRGIDQLKLRFERRSESGDAARRTLWQVRLDFDLHDLGRFSAVLQAGSSGVAATLWSELEQTHHRVRDAVAGLREKLTNSGVKVTDVVCRQGLPGEPPPAAPSNLIDVRT